MVLHQIFLFRKTFLSPALVINLLIKLQYINDVKERSIADCGNTLARLIHIFCEVCKQFIHSNSKYHSETNSESMISDPNISWGLPVRAMNILYDY